MDQTNKRVTREKLIFGLHPDRGIGTERRLIVGAAPAQG
jgi:hypothetical protein